MDTFDLVLEKIVTDGPYQYLMLVAASMWGSFAAMHVMLSAFLVPPQVNFECQVEILKNSSWSLEEQRNFSLPWQYGNYSKCSQYNRDYEYFSTLSYAEARAQEEEVPTVIEKCSHWIYDDSIFESTLISQWDLVCDRQYMRSLVQSSLMIGVLLAAPISGLTADWKGRLPVIWISLVGFLLIGGIITQVKNFYLYLILRFFIGFFGHCLYQTSYVLVLEWCVPKRRSIFGIGFSLPFALGFMFLPILAYYNRRYETLQNYLGGIAFFFFFNVFVLMESPRWLVQKRNYSKAYEVVAKSCKINRQPNTNKQEMFNIFDRIKKEDTNVDATSSDNFKMKRGKSTLLSSPKLRKYTFVLVFDWVSNTLVYYGLSLNSGSFNFNPFLYMFLSGLVELPAYTVIVPIVAKYGRKIPVISSYISCGISVLISLCLPQDSSFWLPLSLNMIGKLCITISFQILFLYTSELYPTSVRTQGIGITTMIGRLGAIGSPFIIDVLGAKFWALPNLIFGTVSICAGLLTLFLPETNNCSLPDTTEDVESIGKKCSSKLLKVESEKVVSRKEVEAEEMILMENDS